MKNFQKLSIVGLLLCIQSIFVVGEGLLPRLLAPLQNSSFKSVAIQADGKKVVAGYCQIGGKNRFAVMRYNADGSLDTTFGSQGLATTQFGAGETASGANAVIIQSDGKIVAGGFTNAVKNAFKWCLARYNVDGSADTGFFGGNAIMPGTVITFFENAHDVSQLNGLAISPDGKITAAGSCYNHGNFEFALARYNIDGSLDRAHFNAKGHNSLPGTVRTSFGAAHIQNDQAFAVALQPDGKIVAAGATFVSGVRTFALARYQSDGSLDNSFFNGQLCQIHGTVVTSFAQGETEGVAHALAIQPDGKILAAGFSNSNIGNKGATRFAVARYTNQGLLDQDFGGLDTIAGTLLSSFGPHEMNGHANAIMIQPDGKIIVGGLTKIDHRACCALARYNADGSDDSSFNRGNAPIGKAIAYAGGNWSQILGLALAPDGTLIAVGSADANAQSQGLIAEYAGCQSLQESLILAPAHNERIVDGSAITLEGIGQSGAIVHVLCDNAILASTFVNADGRWSCVLPPMPSGVHALTTLEQCGGGKTMMSSSSTTNIVVDQHPEALNQIVNTFTMHPVSGLLQAQGASGNYTYKLISVENGTVVLTDNHYIFTPTIETGQGNFVFEVTDAITRCSHLGTVTVIVNETPVVLTGCASCAQDSVMRGDLQSYVASGAAPYMFTLVSPALHAQVSVNADGSFTMVPDKGYTGTISFQYEVTDAKGSATTQTFSITVQSVPVAADATFATRKNQSITHSLAKLASSGTAPYRFAIVDQSKSGTVAVNEDGSFTFTPKADFYGPASFTYQVTDANNHKSLACVTVNVCPIPAVSDGTFVTKQNKEIQSTLGSLLVNKSAPSYTFTQVGRAKNGQAVVNPDGTFSFVPDKGFHGIARFLYKVTDNNQFESNVAVVMVTVQEIPAVTNAALGACQNVPLQSSLADLVSGGTAPYTFVLANRASNGSVVLSKNGSFIYTPTTGYYGTDSFQYVIYDANGTKSAPATLTITVTQAPVASDSSFTTTANTALSATVNNLVSSGIQPYIFSALGSTNGTVAMQSDGSFVFAPQSNFDGTATFGYQVTDANQCSASGIVSVTVYPVPSASDGSYSILENETLADTVAPLAAGGTPPYTFAHVGSAVNGSVQVQSDGSFSFVPDAQATSASFQFAVTDANQNSSQPATITITLLELPKVTNIAVSTCQDIAVAASLASNVTGANPPYAFMLVQNVQNGVLTFNKNGTYSYAPNAGFYGTDSFKFRAIDATGRLSAVGIGSITVYQAPVANNDTATTYGNVPLAGSLASLIQNGTPPYSYMVLQSFGGQATIDADGIYQFSPDADFVGQGGFTYQVSDANQCSSAPAVITVNVLAMPKVEDSTLNTIVNTPISQSLANLASGGVAPYAFGLVGNNVSGTAVVNADGSFNFVPDAEFSGAASFQYAITDANQQLSNSATITINVYSVPEVQNVSLETCQNNTLTGTLVDAVSNGLAPYTFALVGASANGSLVLNADGSYAYSPAAGFAGADAFQYSVTDSHGITTAVQSAQITVNQSPVAAGITLQGYQNQPLSGSVPSSVSLGTPPYVYNSSDNVNGSVVLAQDGSFVFTPAADALGTAGFSYQVTDAKQCVSNSATVSITIQQPPAVSDAALTTTQGIQISGSLAALASGSVRPLTFALAANASNGTVTLSAKGNYKYVPNAGFNGADSFQYNVTDANGVVSNTATASIEVYPLPSAANGTFATYVNESTSNSVASLVSGGQPPYSFAQVGSGINGQAALQADGTFTFAPAQNSTESGSFQYTVTDANNAISNTGTVTITVNEEIQIAPALFSVCQNNSVSGNLSGLVAGGVPPFSFAAGQVSNGTLQLQSDGSFSFDPAAGFNGNASFAFQVSDAHQYSANAIAQVTVYSAPQAQNGTVSVLSNNLLSGSLMEYVSSGTQPYSFAQVGAASNGVAVIDADGSYTFTPDQNFTGTATVQFTVTDANGCATNTGALNIVVYTVPQAASAVISTTQNAQAAGNLNSLVSSGQSPYVFLQVRAPQNGSLNVARSGAYTYTPNTDFYGTDSFGYVAIDANGYTSKGATITIQVNQLPTVADSAFTMCEYAVMSNTLSSSASGGQPPYTFAAVNNATNGVVSLKTDGSFNFMPTSGFYGTAGFQYQITDANGATSNVATVTITINPTPVATGFTLSGTQDTALAGTLAQYVSSGTPGYLFSNVGKALNGQVTIASDGSFTFSPDANFTGTASFQYNVVDANSCSSNIATVTIIVNPATRNALQKIGHKKGLLNKYLKRTV